VTPTPWAVYRFQPAETIIQFAFYPLILLVIPIHVGVLIIFLTYNILVNTGGHAGFEFIPDRMKNHWFFKWSNCVTHHDIHHSKFNFNFGLYFNFWDRLMGTFMNDLSKNNVVSDQIAK
jgi:sterol desaturase/sphingolipid hydroxylase (fatty acid hydroxylase superfamily)